MKIISLSDFRLQVENKLKELEIEYTPELIESLRNKGLRRTSENRELLKVIDDRCNSIGIVPIKSYY